MSEVCLISTTTIIADTPTGTIQYNTKHPSNPQETTELFY